MNGMLFDLGPAAFVMPFGRHRGKPIADVPDGYLAWILREPGMRQNVKRAAAEEMQRRDDLAQDKVAREREVFVEWCALRETEPRTVLGVELNAAEAALFEYAVAWGELVITPCMPLASPVPEAWRRYCEREWVEHKVREVGFGEDDE